MVETKDPTLTEYENIIEELMKENEKLKKKISELEEENKLLKLTEYSFKESSSPTVTQETKRPTILFKKSKRKEKSELITEEKEMIAPKVTSEAISAIELTPSSVEAGLELNSTTDPAIPSLTKHSIVEGTSRRECPICGNTFKAFIHEIIDKTNIIMAYPRVYGKKYKCGKCGREWRVPPTLE
ncbi:MAG: hypothetical protein ACFFA0_10300 [Promethearchaeota archaeon]